MRICSLRSSSVLLLVLLSICQGRAQQNESGEQKANKIDLMFRLSAIERVLTQAAGYKHVAKSTRQNMQQVHSGYCQHWVQLYLTCTSITAAANTAIFDIVS
jgi:hypothetical protein